VQIGRARCILQHEGATDSAEFAIAAALATYPSNFVALRLSTQIAQKRGDLQEALKRAKHHIEVLPNDLDALRRALVLALQCADLETADNILNLASPEMRDMPEFKLRLLLKYHTIRRDVAAGLNLLRGIDVSAVAPSDALLVCEFLRMAARFREATALIEETMKRFPSAGFSGDPWSDNSPEFDYFIVEDANFLMPGNALDLQVADFLKPWRAKYD
jgi:tetratricopeptide (TPR) repeat protein